jgi:AcrR family transcriptional regulator
MSSTTAEGRSRGPYATTPARRAQIVRAAVESFAAHGYERASLRDIAARAGLTHAAVLRHFSGKDELLLAALTQHERDEELQAERVMASGATAPAVLAAALADEFDDLGYQRSWLTLAVAATDPAHPAHDFFRTRRARLRAQFRPEPRGPGASVQLTTEERVTLVLAMIDGLRIQALLDPDQDSRHLIETFMSVVMDAGTRGDDTAH